MTRVLTKDIGRHELPAGLAQLGVASKRPSVLLPAVAMRLNPKVVATQLATAGLDLITKQWTVRAAETLHQMGVPEGAIGQLVKLGAAVISGDERAIATASVDVAVTTVKVLMGEAAFIASGIASAVPFVKAFVDQVIAFKQFHDDDIRRVQAEAARIWHDSLVMNPTGQGGSASPQDITPLLEYCLASALDLRYLESTITLDPSAPGEAEYLFDANAVTPLLVQAKFKVAGGVGEWDARNGIPAVVLDELASVAKIGDDETADALNGPTFVREAALLRRLATDRFGSRRKTSPTPVGHTLAIVEAIVTAARAAIGRDALNRRIRLAVLAHTHAPAGALGWHALYDTIKHVLTAVDLTNRNYYSRRSK